jgi:hypothetical protein
MTFASQIAADLGVFFNTDEFAESATYNGTSILAVEDEVSERNTGQPGFASPLFAVFIKAADVPRPKGGDTVVFRSVRCRVGQFPVAQGALWRIELLQDTVQV